MNKKLICTFILGLLIGTTCRADTETSFVDLFKKTMLANDLGILQEKEQTDLIISDKLNQLTKEDLTQIIINVVAGLKRSKGWVSYGTGIKTETLTRFLNLCKQINPNVAENLEILADINAGTDDQGATDNPSVQQNNKLVFPDWIKFLNYYNTNSTTSGAYFISNPIKIFTKWKTEEEAKAAEEQRQREQAEKAAAAKKKADDEAAEKQVQEKAKKQKEAQEAEQAAEEQHKKEEAEAKQKEEAEAEKKAKEEAEKLKQEQEAEAAKKKTNDEAEEELKRQQKVAAAQEAKTEPEAKTKSAVLESLTKNRAHPTTRRKPSLHRKTSTAKPDFEEQKQQGELTSQTPAPEVKKPKTDQKQVVVDITEICKRKAELKQNTPNTTQPRVADKPTQHRTPAAVQPALPDKPQAPVSDTEAHRPAPTKTTETQNKKAPSVETHAPESAESTELKLKLGDLKQNLETLKTKLAQLSQKLELLKLALPK